MYLREMGGVSLLTREGEVVIAKRIEEAREEGDLKENGGYHAAKDEQGKQEARIRTLQHLLKNATVSEAPESTGVVEPGTVGLDADVDVVVDDPFDGHQDLHRNHLSGERGEGRNGRWRADLTREARP